MVPTPRGLIVLALYQLSIAIGILLLPIALITRKIGLTLPFHRVIDRLGDAYERTHSR